MSSKFMKFGLHVIYLFLLFQAIVPVHPKHYGMYGSLDRQYYTPVGGSCTPTSSYNQESVMSEWQSG
jgi:hypothetical protein